MKNLQTYRLSLASLLFSLFSFVLTTQAIHTFVHHHEAHQKICDDQCDKTKAHFHASEDNSEHCNICDFVLPVAELPTLIGFSLAFEKPSFSYTFHYQSPNQRAVCATVLTRGPPSVVPNSNLEYSKQ